MILMKRSYRAGDRRRQIQALDILVMRKNGLYAPERIIAKKESAGKGALPKESGSSGA